MALVLRWKAVRCEGTNRKTRKPCGKIHVEVPSSTPRHIYKFRCRWCGSWNSVEA